MVKSISLSLNTCYQTPNLSKVVSLYCSSDQTPACQQELWGHIVTQQVAEQPAALWQEEFLWLTLSLQCCAAGWHSDWHRRQWAATSSNEQNQPNAQYPSDHLNLRIWSGPQCWWRAQDFKHGRQKLIDPDYRTFSCMHHSSESTLYKPPGHTHTHTEH